MKKIFIFIAAVFSSSCSASQNMSDLAEIYYVPIGVETYIPITMDNIEEHYARYSKSDTNSRAFKKLVSILESSNRGKFESQKVRVKIILPSGQIIFIDNNGGLS